MLSDTGTLLDLLNRGGVVALLLLDLVVVAVGGVRGWFVFGSTHRREVESLMAQLEAMTKDRDRWQGTTLDLLQVNSGAVETVGQAIRAAKGGRLGGSG